MKNSKFSPFVFQFIDVIFESLLVITVLLEQRYVYGGKYYCRYEKINKSSSRITIASTSPTLVLNPSIQMMILLMVITLMVMMTAMIVIPWWHRFLAFYLCKNVCVFSLKTSCCCCCCCCLMGYVCMCVCISIKSDNHFLVRFDAVLVHCCTARLLGLLLAVLLLLFSSVCPSIHPFFIMCALLQLLISISFHFISLVFNVHMYLQRFFFFFFFSSFRFHMLIFVCKPFCYSISWPAKPLLYSWIR